MSDELREIRIMELLLAVRYALWLTFIIAAFLLLLCHWFPSMRGPSWSDNELVSALVLAVLAVAFRP